MALPVISKHVHPVLPLVVTVKSSKTNNFYVEAYIDKRFFGERVLHDYSQALVCGESYFEHLSELLMPIYEKGKAAA